jgi:hypothetical protein
MQSFCLVEEGDNGPVFQLADFDCSRVAGFALCPGAVDLAAVPPELVKVSRGWAAGCPTNHLLTLKLQAHQSRVVLACPQCATCFVLHGVTLLHQHDPCSHHYWLVSIECSVLGLLAAMPPPRVRHPTHPVLPPATHPSTPLPPPPCSTSPTPTPTPLPPTPSTTTCGAWA